jgi:type II secretion system protein N
MKDATKERLKSILPKLGFPLFYLVCLVVFAWWTFPFEKLRDRAVATINEGLRASGQELRVDEVGPAFPFRLRAKGIHFVLGPPPEPGKPAPEIKIDELRVNPSLMGLLFGTLSVSLRADLYGGTVEADYKGPTSDAAKDKKIDLTLEGMGLEPLTQIVGLPFEGALDGSVKITMPEGKALKATGAVSLDAKDVAVGDGKAKLKGPMAIAVPRVSMGEMQIAGDVKDGALKLTKLSAMGKDMELQGEGRVQLRDDLGTSLLDVNARFKINDSFKNKNETTKSLFGSPGPNIPSVFDMIPQVKQSKRADGFYGWHLRGPLAHPDVDPAPLAATPGAGRATVGGPQQ